MHMRRKHIYFMNKKLTNLLLKNVMYPEHNEKTQK